MLEIYAEQIEEEVLDDMFSCADKGEFVVIIDPMTGHRYALVSVRSKGKDEPGLTQFFKQSAVRHKKPSRIKKIIMQTHRSVRNPLIKYITYDDKHITIKGKPTSVIAMYQWLVRAIEYPDRNQMLKYHVKPTKPGKPVNFPLTDESDWDISVSLPH